eukprot:gnl/Chilomastix_cuspidata/4997.p1 GENE.gnl/Chilomastix_cuspidata/4997~~gnl/Chilomastix_cuspidata/4997.p1  ORF type:complete len:1718 (+),score=407.77 gnl/Chilomastix_cuspidata/4997:78-5231(+)
MVNPLAGSYLKFLSHLKRNYILEKLHAFRVLGFYSPKIELFLEIATIIGLILVTISLIVPCGFVESIHLTLALENIKKAVNLPQHFYYSNIVTTSHVYFSSEAFVSSVRDNCGLFLIFLIIEFLIPKALLLLSRLYFGGRVQQVVLFPLRLAAVCYFNFFRFSIFFEYASVCSTAALSLLLRKDIRVGDVLIFALLFAVVVIGVTQFLSTTLLFVLANQRQHPSSRSYFSGSSWTFQVSVHILLCFLVIRAHIPGFRVVLTLIEFFILLRVLMSTLQHYPFVKKVPNLIFRLLATLFLSITILKLLHACMFLFDSPAATLRMHDLTTITICLILCWMLVFASTLMKNRSFKASPHKARTVSSQWSERWLSLNNLMNTNTFSNLIISEKTQKLVKAKLMRMEARQLICLAQRSGDTFDDLVDCTKRSKTNFDFQVEIVRSLLSSFYEDGFLKSTTDSQETISTSVNIDSARKFSTALERSFQIWKRTRHKHSDEHKNARMKLREIFKPLHWSHMNAADISKRSIRTFRAVYVSVFVVLFLCCIWIPLEIFFSKMREYNRTLSANMELIFALDIFEKEFSISMFSSEDRDSDEDMLKLVLAQMTNFYYTSLMLNHPSSMHGRTPGIPAPDASDIPSFLLYGADDICVGPYPNVQKLFPENPPDESTEELLLAVEESVGFKIEDVFCEAFSWGFPAPIWTKDNARIFSFSPIAPMSLNSPSLYWEVCSSINEYLNLTSGEFAQGNTAARDSAPDALPDALLMSLTSMMCSITFTRQNDLDTKQLTDVWHIFQDNQQYLRTLFGYSFEYAKYYGKHQYLRYLTLSSFCFSFLVIFLVWMVEHFRYVIAKGEMSRALKLTALLSSRPQHHHERVEQFLYPQETNTLQSPFLTSTEIEYKYHMWFYRLKKRRNCMITCLAVFSCLFLASFGFLFFSSTAPYMGSFNNSFDSYLIKNNLDSSSLAVFPNQLDILSETLATVFHPSPFWRAKILTDLQYGAQPMINIVNEDYPFIESLSIYNMSLSILKNFLKNTLGICPSYFGISGDDCAALDPSLVERPLESIDLTSGSLELLLNGTMLSAADIAEIRAYRDTIRGLDYDQYGPFSYRAFDASFLIGVFIISLLLIVILIVCIILSRLSFRISEQVENSPPVSAFPKFFFFQLQGKFITYAFFLFFLISFLLCSVHVFAQWAHVFSNPGLEIRETFSSRATQSLLDATMFALTGDAADLEEISTFYKQIMGDESVPRLSNIEEGMSTPIARVVSHVFEATIFLSCAYFGTPPEFAPNVICSGDSKEDVKEAAILLLFDFDKKLPFLTHSPLSGDHAATDFEHESVNDKSHFLFYSQFVGAAFFFCISLITKLFFLSRRIADYIDTFRILNDPNDLHPATRVSSPRSPGDTVASRLEFSEDYDNLPSVSSVDNTRDVEGFSRIIPVHVHTNQKENFVKYSFLCILSLIAVFFLTVIPQIIGLIQSTISEVHNSKIFYRQSTLAGNVVSQSLNIFSILPNSNDVLDLQLVKSIASLEASLGNTDTCEASNHLISFISAAAARRYGYVTDYKVELASERINCTIYGFEKEPLRERRFFGDLLQLIEYGKLFHSAHESFSQYNPLSSVKALLPQYRDNIRTMSVSTNLRNELSLYQAALDETNLLFDARESLFRLLRWSSEDSHTQIISAAFRARGWATVLTVFFLFMFWKFFFLYVFKHLDSERLFAKLTLKEDAH